MNLEWGGYSGEVEIREVGKAQSFLRMILNIRSQSVSLQLCLLMDIL